MKKRDEDNPLSPRYERRWLDPAPKKTGGSIEGAITGFFVGIFSLAVALLVGGFMLSVIYGIIVLIFRNAFGVELPNPFNLLR